MQNRYNFTLEVSNGKARSYASANVIIKLGQIPGIKIVRKKNAPEKVHPFKQFLVRGSQKTFGLNGYILIQNKSIENSLISLGIH